MIGEVLALCDVADPHCPTCHGTGLAGENFDGQHPVVPCWCVLDVLVPCDPRS